MILPKTLIFFCCLFVVRSFSTNPTAETPSSTEYTHYTSEKQVFKFEEVFQNYNKKERPFLGEKHVPIEISMYFLGFSNLNYEKSELTSDFYFRQIWNDPRLAHSSSEGDLRFTHEDRIMEKMWIPDTFFINGKNSYVQKTTIPNIFVRILPNGTVMLSQKISLTSYCFMDLHRFPEDVQTCSITAASYGFLKRDMFYSWKQDSSPVGFSQDIKLQDFTLIDHQLDTETKTVSGGEYSQVKLQLTFQRNNLVYIFQIHLPAALMVILSWMSFWLTPNALIIRMTTGVTALVCSFILTLFTFSLVPNAGCVKNIDIYVLTNLAFTILAFIENFIVCNLAKRHRLPFNKQLSDEFPLHEDSYSESSGLDKFSQFFFPTLFAIFNVIYWLTL